MGVMEIHPLIASVVGKTTSLRWGQVLQLPHAYGVVEIATADGIARQRGITVLSKLTQALTSQVVSLEALASVADGVMEEDVVSLALIVPVGKVVYVVLRGGGAVFMRRGDKFATLIKTPGNISGEIEEHDCIIASSHSFTNSLTPEEVAGVFDHRMPEEVAERLTLLLHEKHGGEGGAALIFEVSALISPQEVSVREELVVDEEKPLPKLSGIDISLLGQAMRTHAKKLFEWIRHTIKTQKRMAIAIGLILLFLVSVILGVRKQAGNVRGQKTSEIVAEAQHAFDEGMALLDLNTAKGRERLAQAEALLKPVVASVSDRTIEGRSAHTLYAQVLENMTRAQRITKISPAVFYDASLLKKDAQISAFAVTDERMGLLDSMGRTVFDLSPASKNGQISAGGAEYDGASHVAVYGDRIYVLVPEGIHLVRLSDRKTVPLVVKKDDGWGTMQSLIAYGGGLYLLDSGKSRIWKYVATEAGFSERREYLNPDTLPDLSQAVSMAIDGSVWVGFADGRIQRFTQGKEQTFVLRGLDRPLGANIQIETNDELTHLYVLDKEQKRIVVFDKEGLYIAQYVWESDLAPTGIAVSEDSKLIFLLAAGKIYSTPLE